MCTVRRNLMKNKLLLVAVVFLSAISIGTAARFSSGGLGLSRNSWEEKQGKPNSKCLTNMLSTCYEGGRYVVTYTDNFISRLEIYQHPFPYTYKVPGISINESRSLSRNFIPADSRLLKKYKSRTSGSTVDLYMSESLKYLDSQVPAKDNYLWLNGEAGNFVVIHSGASNDVKKIIINTGNNP